MKIKSLKPYRFKDNPKEEELFNKFVYLYSKSADLSVFGQKVGTFNTPQDYLTNRELEIVASTIQWLGSPLGQGFLNECGFKLELDER